LQINIFDQPIVPVLTPARLGYYDLGNDSCVIVGVQATAARMSQETVAAQNMLTRFSQW
jgi:hypothetical protein